ncbi:protein of unknown function [endosymbiont DhMRE of Dentiscutata heterogama]|uniref:hypothetical protein n=1 Tax=endosymbiont DhMRE of Dentiscutata heterogama TaxID=1609546 RepID=UPI000629D869|nr:hypothetical protein [endosymbiont DhMRE of Dentiscutata heterogama]CFW93353.1 protein of unknown function [endosymbiont DhMRE of Dentiscutata heterogama]
MGVAAPALIVWWFNRPKPKSSPKTRLIRKEGQIAKAKLRHKWELELLEIEKQTILKEIDYETEKLRWESGLGEKRGPEPENNSDLLSGLKQQGANLFQKGVGQAKQVVGEKINQATKVVNEKANQFTKSASDKIDEVTEKIKPKKEE